MWFVALDKSSKTNNEIILLIQSGGYNQSTSHRIFIYRVPCCAVCVCAQKELLQINYNNNDIFIGSTHTRTPHNSILWEILAFDRLIINGKIECIFITRDLLHIQTFRGNHQKLYKNDYNLQTNKEILNIPFRLVRHKCAIEFHI